MLSISNNKPLAQKGFAMKSKLIMILLSLIVVAAFLPVSASAATKVKMTAYNQVVKSGNTVYCPSAGWGIFKVKVTKSGKVKSKKWLIKSGEVFGAYTYIGAMKKKGKYLYFDEGTEGTISYLRRVNLSTGKAKTIAQDVGNYVIKKKKIYAEIWKDSNDDGDFKPYRYVMKLNGKSKKKTKVKPVMKIKGSNAKGYSVIYKEKGDYVKTYLKTPKGKYYLGKTKLIGGYY